MLTDGEQWWLRWFDSDGDDDDDNDDHDDDDDDEGNCNDYDGDDDDDENIYIYIYIYMNHEWSIEGVTNRVDACMRKWIDERRNE